MTGFASQTLIIEQSHGQTPLHLTIHLKSLNSRFFEITCKMPPSLSALETDLIKELKSVLHRGQIYLTIHLHNPNSLISEISAATQTVAGYLEAIKAIQKQYQLPGEIKLDQIIRLPHVFSFKEIELDETLKRETLQAITTLANELIEARNTEGLVLQQDLDERVRNMQTLIQAVIEQSAKDIAAKKVDMINKIEQFSKEFTDETLLENQKAYLHNSLDKMDVHEEITRFCGHLKKLAQILKSDAIEKGKNLDFTLQECNREINTIASKANSLEINTLAIEVKVEIEKARQQVQNII